MIRDDIRSGKNKDLVATFRAIDRMLEKVEDHIVITSVMDVYEAGLLEKLGIAQNPGQGVVDLMGHARCQFSQGGHLVGLD